MSTNLERERQRKKKAGDMLPKLNEKKKKERRELEREIKNKGDIFCWENNIRFCSGSEKMRNASGHQGENERQWKKSEKERVRKFPHKTCY